MTEQHSSKIFNEEKKEQINTFLDFTKHIPLITVLILVLGITKTSIYYSSFDIPIMEYLTLSEIGLMVTSDFILMLIILLCTSFIYFQIVDKRLIAYFNRLFTPKTNAVLFQSISVSLFFVIVFTPNFFIKSIMVIAILTIQLLYLEVTKINYLTLLLKDKSSYFIGFVFLIALHCVIIIALLNVHGAKRGIFDGTKIITKDSTYISRGSFHYLGKTSEFVFFRNSIDRSNIIISKSEIISFSLKGNNSMFTFKLHKQK